MTTPEYLTRIADEHFEHARYDQAVAVADEALALAREIHDAKQEAVALHILGMIARVRGNCPVALSYHTTALHICEAIDDREGVAKAMNGFGNVYESLSDYPEAIEYYRKSLAIYEELGSKSGIAVNLSNIGLVYHSLSDYANALEYYQKALAINEEIGNKDGIARNFSSIGNTYYSLSDYDQAVDYIQKSLAINEEIGSKVSIASNLGNIGNMYYSLSDYTNALKYHHMALAINEEIGSKSAIAINLGNIGLVYGNLLDSVQALEYFQRALAISEEIGNKYSIARNLGNIGNVFNDISDSAQALEYYQKSLAINEELGSKYGIAINLSNIGIVYAEKNFEGYDPMRAEENLQQALVLSHEIGNKALEYRGNKVLAELYKQERRWEEAHRCLEKYIVLKEEVQTEAAKKQANIIEQRRQAAEREKDLAVERSRAKAIEEVLNNTLPPIIAERLIKRETFIADHYDAVSVLFMDLVNFTSITEVVPPRHLVYLLNSIFSTADAVMQNHGLEKIKTIGDAYMAAAGAPLSDANHAANAAAAALDLLEAMNNLHIIIPEELGDRSWMELVADIQVRIGLHCGAAIGGVIGDKKFSFDLWGDAVNTASRMESHGEAGRIHCSEDFARELGAIGNASITHSNTSFVISARGTIEIKGKGKMQTYFLERYTENVQSSMLKTSHE